jgi:ADP-dependent NAD(P)H-hydrate dehydratase / NAD(P)H-hydrate epimerase
MVEIFSPQQMKAIDEFAINKLNVPSLWLMENAGHAVADEILKLSSVKKKRVLVFCGKGNNGGDGLAVARLLWKSGARVIVVLLDSRKEFSGDAAVNFDNIKSLFIPFFPLKKFLEHPVENYSIVVDAIFGTSFHGAVEGKYLKAIQWINAQKKCLKIAVDIPSGLNGETGEVETEAVRADDTVTLSNPKTGFYRKNAKDYTGSVMIKGIGIPEQAFRVRSDIFLVEENDARTLLPHRASNSHKHSVGKIFVLAGSKGMMGAALMSSQSAMRTGAGQVILGIPDSEYAVIAKRTLEVMPLALPATGNGSLSLNARSEIEKRIAWSNVVLMGCGMSPQPETQTLIRNIVVSCRKPMVIDADALNALAVDISILKKTKTKQIILTPHYGEFSKLIGVPSSEIEERKFELAKKFAEQNNIVLVLKGAPTITALPDGSIFVNSTGNPGMATAGAGDVLSGMIAAFVGQGLTAESAALLGVYLHGLAGDAAARKYGEISMMAGDIIKQIPATIKNLLK